VFATVLRCACDQSLSPRQSFDSDNGNSDNVLDHEKHATTDSVSAQPRLVAVIDIGSTSLRMQIAEIHSDRSVRRIESFSQAVSLGEDSFLKRSIELETIEDCVKVLSGYRDQLRAYGIEREDDIRVVATSGLNEAGNKRAFRDRIFIATGFEIEPFDEAELHRVTYLGVLPFLMNEPDVSGWRYFRSLVAQWTRRFACANLSAWLATTPKTY